MNVITKPIKKHPWLTTLTIIFFIYLTVMLFVTKGQNVRIETTPTSQDYVIICGWDSNMFVVHGGRRRVATRIAVIGSDETYSCGYSVLGALMYAHPNVTYMHPIYTSGEMSSWEEVDGVQVIKPITKLKKLDELRAKFEEGYWDKFNNPGSEYSNNMVGCGFPNHYFDYYSKKHRVDTITFKEAYHDAMLKCLERSFSITKKYDPQISKQLPEADEWMRILWKSDNWSKYR